MAQRVATHVATAASARPSLHERNVTPHTLRHTAATRLLHAGVDTTVIALWLGHEHVGTTDIYRHADLALEEHALERTTPVDVRAGRYHPPDRLLAFLEGMWIMPMTSAQTPLAALASGSKSA